MDAVIPLTMRIQRLEAQVGILDGFPNLGDEERRQGERKRQESIVRRVEVAKETFERIGRDSEGLKRLLEGCEYYF